MEIHEPVFWKVAPGASPPKGALQMGDRQWKTFIDNPIPEDTWVVWPESEPDFIDISNDLLKEVPGLIEAMPWDMLFVKDTEHDSQIWKRGALKESNNARTENQS